MNELLPGGVVELIEKYMNGELSEAEGKELEHKDRLTRIKAFTSK